VIEDVSDTLVDRPQYYLIHDEVIEFLDSRANDIPVRVRLWMAKDAMPVVLVSQVRKYQVRWVTIQAANFIFESLLRFGDVGFLYFEYGDVCIGGKDSKGWTNVTFELFGHANRSRLFRPYFIPEGRCAIEDIVGKVEV
jgi:hypothetical protein